MTDELVPIATFITPAQAAAARCALEAQGVESFLKDDNVSGTLVGNVVGYVKLLVAAPDSEKARHLLDTPYDDWPGYAQPETWKCRQCGEEIDARFDRCQHCGTSRHAETTSAGQQESLAKSLSGDSEEARQRAANPYASPRSESPYLRHQGAADEPTTVESGPRARCPSCGRARMAVCPFCKTSGAQFRSADIFANDLPADEPEMLICPTCDEPFDARYLRVCEWCGHDFGSGVEAPPIVPDMPAEALNWRVWLVGLGGVAVVSGLVIYFAAILGR